MARCVTQYICNLTPLAARLTRPQLLAIFATAPVLAAIVQTFYESQIAPIQIFRAILWLARWRAVRQAIPIAKRESADANTGTKPPGSIWRRYRMIQRWRPRVSTPEHLGLLERRSCQTDRSESSRRALNHLGDEANLAAEPAQSA